MNGILLLYFHPLKANASTILEHVNGFARHSQFKVWNLNIAFGYPEYLINVQFKVIVLHYSLFESPIVLNAQFLNFLKTSIRSYKITFLQDEHRYWSERIDFINTYDVNCIYTLVEPEYFDETYRKYTNVSKIIYNLPGYVSDEMKSTADKFGKPQNHRTIDIGYRGRRLPFYMGNGSQEKHIIGIEFKKRASSLGFRLDIETDEKKRIYGIAWHKFLANCKANLGVETGVSVFDIDNIVRPQYEELCNGNPDFSFPDCGFHEVFEKILAPHEDKIYYRTIGPRHFEACSFKVCQILFEGKYSGILEPVKHYIPLKKDFSNFGIVIKMFRNKKLRSSIVDQAYRDIIGSGKYTMQKFIEQFDEELISEGFSADISIDDINFINKLLKKDRWKRMFKTGLHTPFPGRTFIKLLVKPILEKMGI